jgi:hypothetical protein
MKLPHFIFALACLAGAVPALAQTSAQEAGYAIRQTEIKQEPYSDAANAGTLPERAQVKIVARQGGWLKIESASGAGWVRLLAIRTGATDGAGGDSGLKQLFNVARSGSSGTAVATGVRGLDKEQIRNAQPNIAELQRMERFAATQADADRFASSSRLVGQAIDYLPAQQAGFAESTAQ